jgi:hypothetical protein
MYGRVKDPEKYGAWTRAIKSWLKKTWKKIKHWTCKVGLCNIETCKCFCHTKEKNK